MGNLLLTLKIVDWIMIFARFSLCHKNFDSILIIIGIYLPRVIYPKLRKSYLFHFINCVLKSSCTPLHFIEFYNFLSLEKLCFWCSVMSFLMMTFLMASNGLFYLIVSIAEMAIAFVYQTSLCTNNFWNIVNHVEYWFYFDSERKSQMEYISSIK